MDEKYQVELKALESKKSTLLAQKEPMEKANKDDVAEVHAEFKKALKREKHQTKWTDENGKLLSETMNPAELLVEKLKRAKETLAFKRKEKSIKAKHVKAIHKITKSIDHVDHAIHKCLTAAGPFFIIQLYKKELLK